MVVASAFFAIQSYREDLRTLGVAAQLQKQRQHEEEFMKAPFQPEVVSAPVGGAPAKPLAGKGQSLFTSQGCNCCHGENGAGTVAAPKATAIGNKYDSAKLESLLKSPTTAMQLSGMEPVDLKQEDLDVLVTYLQSLK